MGKHVTFDYSLADKFIREDEVELMMASIHAARETLESKSGAGNDFLGWIDLPEDYDKAEFERIQAAAKKIQSDSDVLVVIGIGVSKQSLRMLCAPSISFVISAPLAAIGRRPTAVNTDGNVPNLQIRIPEQNEFYLGELFYFFEYACGISGYLLGVNPFNQPGVESYKKNMFALLGKPGYEELSKELLARLS